MHMFSTVKQSEWHHKIHSTSKNVFLKCSIYIVITCGIIHFSSLFQLAINATTGTDYSGDIAIDDIMVTPGQCGHSSPNDAIDMPSNSTSSTSLFDCSFEMPAVWCNMEQAKGDDFDWTRHSGKTKSLSTGPRGAFEGDYYMYIEASPPRKKGDSAL